MITRLNGIKMTNLLINQSSFFRNRMVIIIETFMISAQPTLRKSGFPKFYHLFTDKFFRYEKWKNSFKNRIKLQVGDSPKHLITAIFDMTFVQEVKLTSKMTRSPIKERIFRVIALQLAAISEGFTFRLHPTINIQTAFGIYVASKISKVFFSRLNSISHVGQFFFERRSNQSSFFFKVFQSFSNRFFQLFTNSFSKVLKSRRFQILFNKVSGYVGKINKTFMRKSKMIARQTIRCFWLNNPNRSIKSFSKPQYRIFTDRYYYKVTSPFLIASLKATISIYITRCVSKICVVHAIIMRELAV